MPTLLTGQIEHITFTNEENGFTIARVRVDDHRDLVTVVGNLLSPTPGEIIDMEGEWGTHPKFGQQFKVDQFKTSVPATVLGIRKYLGSGLIKGLGPVMADRIVDKFGKKTLEIIENDIERLTEIQGVGKKRIAMISAGWDAQREIRDVMLFLQTYGVGSGTAAKIFKKYGSRSVAILKENPYRLASEIFGIGFLTADSIADKLGFPRNSSLRAEAGVLYMLQQFAGDGHVYYPYDLLVQKCMQTLTVDSEPILGALARLLDERKIIADDIGQYSDGQLKNGKAVYLAKYHLCETGVAARLKGLLSVPACLPAMDAANAVDWVQQRLTINLADNQVAAVRCAVESKIMVITGGPGTGKTTIVNAILKIFTKRKARILLAAPTGRAAKRMGEASGNEARTIHRLLEYSLQKGGFQRDENKPLDCQALIVDEASMIDTVLMYHLLKAVPLNATLILVGDVNQLPSVGAGNVLNDLIACGSIAVVTLNKIFRQARTSQIIVNAHKINDGLVPYIDAANGYDPQNDFYFIEQEDPEKVLDIILELNQSRIPRRFGLDPVDDIQVLTPMYKGVVGAVNLNARLQAALNPGAGGIQRGERTYRVNDKVMQIRNNYDKEVFNGDIGRITGLDPENRKIVVTFESRAVDYEFSGLDEIVPAYAISIHKSQGSEYPAVIIPLVTQHFIMLQRNLIYTAVTRGRSLVVLVGSRKALTIGVKNNKTVQRYTNLKYRLG